jgi:LysM repeat protein
MRMRNLSPLIAAAFLVAPSAATAAYPHTVVPGESLSSIAAADGLSVTQLAAANGLSSASQLLAGSTVLIPPQSSGIVAATSTPATSTPATSTPAASSAPSTAESTSGYVGDGDNDADDVAPASMSSGTAPVSTSSASRGSGGYLVQPGDTLSAIAARAGTSVAALAAANGLNPNGLLISGAVLRLSGSSSSAGASVPVSTTSVSSGSYRVQPGDTLSAIAARAGMSVAQLAVNNGIDPNGTLLAGSVLSLSGSSSGSAVPVSTSVSAIGQPVGAVAQGNPSAPPYPTPERVTASQIGSVASANGVSPSLAAAIGWQESGFNNDLVSSADARGVMQILPGTWDWIQRTLTAGAPLAPASAADNVRGGVLLLHSLLSSTGGDPAMAAAGYYQGLSSVQRYGMFNDTKAYVNSVLALRQRFGGG